MYDLYFYLAAAFGVIVFGISKGGFAAPIAILAIPVMSLSMSPTKAAGILLPILILMDLLAMYIYWNKWDLKNIKIIIPTSIIGIFIGSLSFQFISENGIEIAGIEYVVDQSGEIFTYDVNTNTNYNSQAEKYSKIKGMKAIAEFLKKELLLLSNIKVVA